MAQQPQSTLDVIYENWRGYQEKLRNAIAPLTADQLMLQPAPHMWPLGQILQHIIAVREGWFSGTLQDENEIMSAYMAWGRRDSPHAAGRNWPRVWTRPGRSSRAACSAGRPRTAPRPSRMSGRARCTSYPAVG